MTRPKRWHVYLLILALILIVSCCHKKPYQDRDYYSVNIDRHLLPARIFFSDNTFVEVSKSGQVLSENQIEWRIECQNQ